MIDDLKCVILERFNSLGFYEVITFMDGFSIYLVGFSYLNTDSLVCSVIFHNQNILVRIGHTVGRDNTYTFSYDDLIDIDIFIGSILCMRFYDV